MAMPAEDAYWQIGGDTSRFWSSARRTWVGPTDAGLLAWLALPEKSLLPALTVSALNKTLADIGLPELSPAGVGAPNYRAMIRRRAHALAEDGDEIGALLLLKSAINE